MRYRRKQSKTEKNKKCTSCRKAQNVHTENAKKQIHTKNKTELQKKVDIHKNVGTHFAVPKTHLLDAVIHIWSLC